MPSSLHRIKEKPFTSLHISKHTTYVPYPPPPPPPRKHKNTFNRKESTHLNQFELLYNKDTKQVIETTNQLNIPHSLFFTNTNPQTQKPDSFRQVR